MALCPGCGRETGSNIPCEACLGKAIAGVRRLQQARQRLLERWPRLRAVFVRGTPQQGVTAHLQRLQALGYLLLVPASLFLGLHPWFWYRLLRSSCAARMGEVITLCLLLGTLGGLWVGLRCGETFAHAQLKRFMAVPEQVSLMGFIRGAMWEQLRDVLRMAGGVAAVLAIVLGMTAWLRHVPAWLGNVTGLGVIVLLQFTISSAAAMPYGFVRSSRWVSACLARVRTPVGG